MSRWGLLGFDSYIEHSSLISVLDGSPLAPPSGPNFNLFETRLNPLMTKFWDLIYVPLCGSDRNTLCSCSTADKYIRYSKPVAELLQTSLGAPVTSQASGDPGSASVER